MHRHETMRYQHELGCTRRTFASVYCIPQRVREDRWKRVPENWYSRGSLKEWPKTGYWYNFIFFRFDMVNMPSIQYSIWFCERTIILLNLIPGDQKRLHVFYFSNSPVNRYGAYTYVVYMRSSNPDVIRIPGCDWEITIVMHIFRSRSFHVGNSRIWQQSCVLRVNFNGCSRVVFCLILSSSLLRCLLLWMLANLCSSVRT